MLFAAVRLLSIKDLKDLSVLRSAPYYRHVGPKGPKEMFFYPISKSALRSPDTAVHPAPIILQIL